MGEEMKKIYNWLFPNWETTRYTQGEWNINVSTDLFGNYSETKYCHFWIMHSKRLNKYKLEINGYKPHEHRLFELLYREVIKLNQAAK